MRDAMLDIPGAPSTCAPPDFAPPQLQTTQLGFKAASHTLLKGIDLTLRPGSRTVIMGPNGAGKSLLLRLLHGLIAPTQGHVSWNGKPLDKADRKNQAMVFQRPVLLRRSVRANLNFALSVRGRNTEDKPGLIEKALASAGLAHLAKRPARVLSGGEQQRLAVVRALACEPEILFLDEPTASLDPASTVAIEQLVMDANQRGITIVLVTHDAGQARRMGKDLVFLQNGEIAETGPVNHILAAPKSAPLRAWTSGELYTGT